MRDVLRGCAVAAVLVAPLAAALVAGAGPAIAQDSFPDRPIRLVVAFTPGGGTDVMARQISEDLKQVLGQPVVVENRPGASGAIGWQHVAASEPDGYTILLAENALAINPNLYKRNSFDPLKQFDPICRVATAPMVLVVSNKVPVNAILDFVAAGKTRENKFSYSSSGIGSVSHLMFEVFRANAGMPALHVPYKGGGQAIGDVVAGHVDATMATIPVAKSLIDAGQLKGLAVTSDQRSAVLPNVPTLKEVGISGGGIEMTFWWGMFTAAGTPQVVKDKIANAVQVIMKKPDLRERFAKLNLDPGYGPASAMKALLVNEITNWGKFIDANGIKAE